MRCNTLDQQIAAHAAREYEGGLYGGSFHGAFNCIVGRFERSNARRGVSAKVFAEHRDRAYQMFEYAVLGTY
jgi:hypothetical protein